MKAMDETQKASVNPILKQQQQQKQQSSDDEFLKSFPPGYRFQPYDHELISSYLQPKLENKELPPNLMHHVNIYEHNPEYLVARYKPQERDVWYFFTPREKKYRNGSRPSRSADDGYWKATGQDKGIKDENDKNKLIGHKRSLDFYRGRPQQGIKTDWMMHEFWLDSSATKVPPKRRRSDDDKNVDLSMRLDDVLCRIFKKKEKDRKHGKEEAIMINDVNLPPLLEEENLPLVAAPPINYGTSTEVMSVNPLLEGIGFGCYPPFEVQTLNNFYDQDASSLDTPPVLSNNHYGLTSCTDNGDPYSFLNDLYE